MIHPTIGTALIDERENEIRSAVRQLRPGHTATSGTPAAGQDEEVTIRVARPADLELLRRLIDLDASGGGTRHMLLDLTRPGSSPRVVVAADGEKLLAALHLDTGHTAADPFEHSGTALELLRARADQLGGLQRPKRFSRRLLPRMRFRSGARA